MILKFMPAETTKVNIDVPMVELCNDLKLGHQRLLNQLKQS